MFNVYWLSLQSILNTNCHCPNLPYIVSTQLPILSKYLVNWLCYLHSTIMSVNILCMVKARLPIKNYYVLNCRSSILATHVLELEIVGEWVMKRQPFWIKIFHISPILLGRFSDKKEWNLHSVLCSLWGIYGRENLQCVFSLQPLQCAMFWFSLKLA